MASTSPVQYAEFTLPHSSFSRNNIYNCGCRLAATILFKNRQFTPTSPSFT